MFRHGHRLFSIASIGLMLVAIYHVIGQFLPSPDDPFLGAVVSAMQSYRLETALGSPSMTEVHESINLALPITLLWMGIANLFIARYTGLRDKLMRRICTLNMVGVLALLVMFSLFQMFTLAIGLGIVDVLFVITRFRLRRSRNVRAPDASQDR